MTKVLKQYSTKKKLTFYTIGFLTIFILMEVAFRVLYFQEHGPTKFAIGQFIKAAQSRYGTYQGTKINKKAWEACFSEHGLEVPASGPREGFWDVEIRPHEKHQVLQWIEGKRQKPGLFDFDERGMQYVKTKNATSQILVLGGSVARGAYASSIEKTYFEKAARILESEGYKRSFSILAASAWTSWQELNAFIQIGIQETPEVVVFLNGLNDLTGFRDLTIEDRVVQYLTSMEAAALFAAQKGIQTVVCLQPILLDKPLASNLEKTILSYENEPENLKNGIQMMRVGLMELEKEGTIVFWDCSQALNDTEKTMFADIWHFADLGHEKLAKCLAESLLSILDEAKK